MSTEAPDRLAEIERRLDNIRELCESILLVAGPCPLREPAPRRGTVTHLRLVQGGAS